MLKLTFPSLLIVMLTACVIHVGPGNYRNPGAGVDNVFGDVAVASGQTVGNISTVNGSIQISYGATAGMVQSVNGGIELDDMVKVMAIDTVNGSITAGKEVSVRGNIESVNGNIRIGPKSLVDANITSINGGIRLQGVKVLANVENMNGDIEILADSVIAGDIIFRRNEGPSESSQSLPILRIASKAKVTGTILLERPVTLNVEDPALAAQVQYLYLK